jgi:hypothetical protein
MLVRPAGVTSPPAFLDCTYMTPARKVSPPIQSTRVSADMTSTLVLWIGVIVLSPIQRFLRHKVPEATEGLEKMSHVRVGPNARRTEEDRDGVRADHFR